MILTDVINIEICNTRHIYCYSYGRAWRCFGRSALLFYSLCPNIPCREREIPGTDIRLPYMIIDPMTIKQLIERVTPIEQTPTCIVIEIPNEMMPHFTNQ